MPSLKTIPLFMAFPLDEINLRRDIFKPAHRFTENADCLLPDTELNNRLRGHSFRRAYRPFHPKVCRSPLNSTHLIFQSGIKSGSVFLSRPAEQLQLFLSEPQNYSGSFFEPFSKLLRRCRRRKAGVVAADISRGLAINHCSICEQLDGVDGLLIVRLAARHNFIGQKA